MRKSLQTETGQRLREARSQCRQITKGSKPMRFGRSKAQKSRDVRLRLKQATEQRATLNPFGGL